MFKFLLALQCTASTLDQCSAVIGKNVQFSRNEVCHQLFQ